MEQFGQELRKEREARGVALETIAAVTKIAPRHLLALEGDRFADLPGGVLNKGIVRGYARVCGLDEEASVARYEAAYRESGQLKDDDRGWVEFAENIGKARKGNAAEPEAQLRWAGVAALLAVLAVCTWYVWGFVRARAVELAPFRSPDSRQAVCPAGSAPLPPILQKLAEVHEPVPKVRQPLPQALD